MTRHQIKVEEAVFVDDCQHLAFYTKGHVSKKEFLESLKANFPKEEIPPVMNLKRKYWRFIPCLHHSFLIKKASAGAKGAVPVTYWQV